MVKRQGAHGFGGVPPVAAGLITWHRADEPDPLVIPQRWFAEARAADDLVGRHPSSLIESGRCHLPIMQNLKCFKSSDQSAQVR
jgi:hypothetical protein